MDNTITLYSKVKIILKRYFEALNMEQRVVVPQYDADYKPKWITIILLFIATFITTSIAGSNAGGSILEIIINGLPFSLSLLAILFAHEMGHYITARYFGVIATPPYFIPFPSLIGTMGAIIRIKSPIPDKRVLLYIGAMGPIAGFIISCILVIVGLMQSSVQPLPKPSGDSFVPIFGDSLLFVFLVKMILGNIPQGYDVYFSPLAWAGWIGFLVTSLNLMPIGQLDGSHVLYALFGEKQRYAGWLFFGIICILTFLWVGWVVWIILTVSLLMIGHPYIPDGKPLTAAEKIMGYLCIIIFIFTFIPVPVVISGQ